MITHHPTEATLAAFAAGTLDAARDLVVATHLTTCPVCRKAVAAFEAVGGVALRDGAPSPMRPDAFLRALHAVASASQEENIRPQTLAEPDLPATLTGYPLGPWRWIGPGVHFRSVGLPVRDGARTFMLKAAPGTVLPHHNHTGFEWTAVLQGAFRHQQGRYGPGDFDEADEADEHDPVVEEGVACICLVALQGDIRFKSWIGRMIQPFVRL